MKICIKCKQQFTPIIDARLICDNCIDLRNNPLPMVIKPKKPKKRKIKRKPYNKRKKCTVCLRPFNTRNRNGKIYFIRVQGKYCTKLCCDLYKSKFKKYNINYNISPSIKNPIPCKICGKLCIRLPQHLNVMHKMSMNEYITQHIRIFNT